MTFRIGAKCFGPTRISFHAKHINFYVTSDNTLPFLRIQVSDGSGGFLRSEWASGSKSPDR